MSKKSTSIPSKTSTINPNIPPFIPQSHQWAPNQRFIPPVLALPPNTSSPLWPQSVIGAPLTTGYGFYTPQPLTPRFNQYPTNHSMHCCLNNHLMPRPTTHCHPYDHNCNHWSNSGPNGCWSQPIDTNSSSNVTIESITEVKNDSSEDESTLTFESNKGSKSSHKTKETQKQMKQLQEMNDKLKTSLEERTQQLRQTQENLLKLNEKFVKDYIDKYRQNLKKYGDYIREESHRFYQNEDMASKLMSIVEQITVASNKAREEKERVYKSISSQHKDLKDKDNPDVKAVDFEPNSLPDFPDLLLFYKSILDEIPLIFLGDLNQLKHFANNYIRNKSKLTDNGISDCLANSLPFNPETNPLPAPLSLPFNPETNPLPPPSKSMFFNAPPKIADLPKPEFSLFSNNDNVLPLKPEVKPNAPSLTFPRSSSPNPGFNRLQNSIIDKPIDSTPISNGFLSTQMKDKPISPIAKPIPTTDESEKSVSIKPKNSPQNDFLSIGVQKSAQSFSESASKQKPTNTPIVSQKASKSGAEASNGAKLVLNQAQSKLLAKLKEKYSQLSDEILIDSMAETKKSLIDSGNPKGFSGMKISDIISKISEYIDRNVSLMNSFVNSRVNRPMPALKLITNNTIQRPIESQSVNQKGTKGWNKMDRKSGKNDESICSICFDSIPINSKYKTECNHFFHSECISSWIRTDGSCPICRCHVLPPGEYPEL